MPGLVPGILLAVEQFITPASRLRERRCGRTGASQHQERNRRLLMKQRWVLSLAFAALIGGSAAQGAEDDLETAVFAGGCFWCVEEAFDKVEGVVETTSGYTGGTVEDPTYQQVSAGGTGHATHGRATGRERGGQD